MKKIKCYDSNGNSINHLVQWDMNQEIYIDILEYDDSGAEIIPMVHYATEDDMEKCLEYAEVISKDESTGRFKIIIPNIFMEKSSRLYIYLFYEMGTEEDPYTTKHFVSLPILEKPKPDGYTSENNVTYLDFQTLSALIIEEAELREQGDENEKLERQAEIAIERKRIDTIINSGESVSEDETYILKKKLAWTNEDTSVSFATQDVSIEVESAEDYEFYEIVYQQNTIFSNKFTTGVLPIGSGAILSYSHNQFCDRSVSVGLTIKDEEQTGFLFTFGTCSFVDSYDGTDTTDDDTYCIPVSIYLYKKEESTLAEVIDARIDADGVTHGSLGSAIRAQDSQIPNQAAISGNYIQFYKKYENGGESFLFQIDATTLMESGLSLENLELSAEDTGSAIVLHMSDGKVEKSVEIPFAVDSVLSLSSANPVQNRVVTEQLNYLNEELENIKENGIGGEEGVTVRLTNQNGTSTLVGSYGNAITIMFTFTSTENDLPTGNANCKITINGVQKVNMSIPQGLTAIDIAPYLNIGNNTVIVACTDIYGKSRSLAYDVTVIQLSIESTFNATVPYDSDILFKYTPYGSVEKTIHFLIDGDEIGTVVTSLTGKQMTRTIPIMSHGSHKLEVYSTAVLNETELTSAVLTYDIICLESGNTTPIIASVYTTETISQGEQVSIPFIVYDPSRLSCDITLTIYTMESGSEVIYNSQDITVDRSQQTWNTRKYPIGNVYFRIQYGDISKTHIVEVIQSTLNIEAETNDLELYLTSEGRSNNETNPAQWTYGDITTTFENMNWNSVGWVNDENGDACLRLNGDARAEIQFQPFKDDLRVYGKTIELDFVIRDVNNREAIPISCMYNGIGFEVKADTAYLTSEQSKVFCNYKEEERVRVAFVIQSRDEYRMLSIYLNGVMSDAVQYSATDNFQQTNPLNISIGSPYCGVDVYNVRSYSTALTDSGITTNFIADMTDIIKKTEVYENNDIYDEFGEISFAKAKEKNSVMVLIGNLPTYKGDKKTIAVRYYDIEDSNLDFYESLVSADVQGTSSQWFWE